jgi:hypothetical protein
MVEVLFAFILPPLPRLDSELLLDKVIDFALRIPWLREARVR